MVAGRVSIIVASYNHARFLVKRLEGLQAQTYRDIEILVVAHLRNTQSVIDLTTRIGTRTPSSLAGQFVKVTGSLDEKLVAASSAGFLYGTVVS